MDAPFYTVGHSDRDLAPFLDLLEAAGIAVLADVRTYPSSRRFPHFNEGNLEESLADAGIVYEHVSELGGYREAPDDAESVDGVPEKWRAYAAHVQSDEFEAGLDRLLELRTSHGPVAFMCAERDPERCHRQFVADVLVTRGHRVVHLVGPDTSREHTLQDAAEPRDDGTVVYPAPQKELPL